MRGRRKPTPLKILEGAQPCRINYDEPKIPPGPTRVPAWLHGVARDYWKEIAPVLSRAGLLTEADVGPLAMLCDDYRNWRERPNDTKARDRYRRMCVEFGMTPQSRTRLKSTAEKPKDELEEFLAG